MNSVFGDDTISDETTWAISAADELSVARLAGLISLDLRAGDVIRLAGELGAGKTTFARAFVRAVLGDELHEVPSPTFPIVQIYECARITVAHFDFYRLSGADEAIEIGLEDSLAAHFCLMEWPDRVSEILPDEGLRISIREVEGSDRHRDLELRGRGRWRDRLARLRVIDEFLHRSGWGDAQARFLQGDASPRAYARLRRAARLALSPHPAPDGDKADGATQAVLMDFPRQADGPPIRNGKSYSEIAHIAEDVRAFAAVGDLLAGLGFSTPTLYESDLDAGLLLIEDLGDRVFGAEIAAGADVYETFRPALRALAHLAGTQPPRRYRFADGSEHVIPQFDLAAFSIEAELLLDWYLPAVGGGEVIKPDVRDEFLALWSKASKAVLGHSGWLLRDFHSPNLLVLEGRSSPRDVGIIDFQDTMRGHPAYDLVSLCQDARLDVSREVEEKLKAAYIAERAAVGIPVADVDEFWRAYAILGAQRASKILGIFTRLARRDGKPNYLAHLPRVWDYLQRNLAHPDLAELRDWYERHVDPPIGQIDLDDGSRAALKGPVHAERASHGQTPRVRSAMILCAGLGTRMRPLTDDRPKPLVPFLGRPLVDHIIDRLVDAGIERVVLNIHYLPEQMEHYALERRDVEIILSDERAELLDTGGGVANARGLLGDEPFLIHNADAIWFDGEVSTLQHMFARWDDTRMDTLLMLTPQDAASGHDGVGDFYLDETGRIERRGERPSAPYVFAGVSLAHPRLFSDAPKGAFSLNRLWDRALRAGRLEGFVHDGLWLHIGDPQSLKNAEQRCSGTGR